MASLGSKTPTVRIAFRNNVTDWQEKTFQTNDPDWRETLKILGESGYQVKMHYL